MAKTVAHFIRKDTQLKASFIQNQILNHKNYSPVIIYKYRSPKDDGGFADFDFDKLPILDLWNDKSSISKLLYQYPKLITKSDIKKIDKFLFKHKVDILHFHYGTDSGLYLPFLKNTSLPSVVSFYGYDCSGFPKRFFGYGKYYLNKRVFPHISKILAMSEDMKKDLIKIGAPNEKVIVHYHGTDAEKFNVLHDYKDQSIITFLIISGLEPQKGHLFLLESFRDSYKQNKNIRLRIFGSGQLENELKDLIKTNKMDNYVKLLGKVTYGSKQHLEEFKNADIFIHPSVTDTNGDKEGIPGAVVEAMAAGLPVISTYHAGIPHIIVNGITGLLVNEWDIKSLTLNILKLASDLDLRKKIGVNAKQYALSNLDLHLKEEELEQIYNNLIFE